MIKALTELLRGILQLLLLYVVLRTLLNIVLRGRLNNRKQQRMLNPKGHFDYKIYKMKLRQIRYSRIKKSTKKTFKFLFRTAKFLILKIHEYRTKSSKQEVSTIWTDFTCAVEESMIGTAVEPVIPYWTDNTCAVEEALIGMSYAIPPITITVPSRTTSDYR